MCNNEEAVDQYYKREVISLIDIIGFREMLNIESPPDILKCYEIIEESVGFTEDEMSMFEHSSFFYSDTFIRSIPIIRSDGQHNRTGILWNELYDLAHVQATLIWEGQAPLRGGITVGDVYHDDTHFFGPGFLRAYDLENDIAIYPRIVLDPQVIKMYKQTRNLRSDLHDYETDLEYVMQKLRMDSDGVWFVDYGRHFQTELDDPYEYLEFLLAHKDFILSRSEHLNDFNRKAAKYLWMANYHNEIIRELEESGDFTALEMDEAEYFIPEERIEFLQYI